jgi:hypothetical protein
MKKILVICFATLVLSSAAATTPAKDDEDVRRFIHRLYSFSIANFELATFDSHLNLKRHCELLKLFFVESLVKQPNISSGCGLNEMGSIRYPSVSAEQLGSANAAGRISKAVLSEPEINMDKATISVTTWPSRTIYFLERSLNDWRIANALLYERWPTSDGLCRGAFLTAPTQDQKKIETQGCLP